MKIFENIVEVIGNTPIVKVNNLNDPDIKANILVKIEAFNPMGSVKDRIAFSMINEAEKHGKINKNTLLVEPTSGNTGIALAYISAVKGYKLTLTMPETMSVERRNLLKAFGANLVLTPGEKGMRGAIEAAEELVKENPNSYMFNQFKNPDNPKIHRETTAKEILEATEGKIDAFVSGIGTGGTITGTGEVLKEKIPEIKIIAVEPKDSPVLSGGNPGPHKIQGIGAGFIPDVLNKDIYDEVIGVENEEAMAASLKLAKGEGILAGISSGAAFHAAIELAKRDEFAGKTILALLPDTGERYLSVGYLK